MATLAQDQLHPVDPLDVSRSELYRDDTWQEPFRTLHATAPIHYTEHSDYGAYWSLPTYKPIVRIESLPQISSPEVGGITHGDLLPGSDFKMPMLIARGYGRTSSREGVSLNFVILAYAVPSTKQKRPQ